jgi:hypothetical protein
VAAIGTRTLTMGWAALAVPIDATIFLMIFVIAIELTMGS